MRGAVPVLLIPRDGVLAAENGATSQLVPACLVVLDPAILATMCRFLYLRLQKQEQYQHDRTIERANRRKTNPGRYGNGLAVMIGKRPDPQT